MKHVAVSFYIIASLFNLLCAYYVYRTPNIIFIDKFDILGYCAIVQLIISINSWRENFKIKFDAYLIFLIVSYCFNISQPIIHAIGIHAEKKSLLVEYYITERGIIQAIYFSLFFLSIFHLGALLSKSASINIPSFLNQRSPAAQLESIRKAAKTTFWFSLPFYLILIASSMYVSLVYGYKNLYDSALFSINKIVYVLSNLFVPSMICLFFVSEYTGYKKLKNRLLLLFLVFLPPLIIGGRTNTAIIAGIISLIYSYFNKISLKKVLIGCVLAIGLLSIFEFVGRSRNEIQKDFSNVLFLQNNVAVETINEMGWSMFPLCNVVDIVPDHEPYRLGDSYLYSLTTIIPNIGFWDVHPAQVHCGLSEWLRDYLNMGYGPGFSFIAEAYLNFGPWGWIIMLLSGYYFTLLFRFTDKKYVVEHPVMLIVGLLLFWFTIKIVRNNFMDVIRGVFYYILPIYLLIKYNLRKCND